METLGPTSLHIYLGTHYHPRSSHHWVGIFAVIRRRANHRCKHCLCSTGKYFFPQYTARRLILVFFFGLIHGLGFAGALSDLNLDPSVLIVSLVGFNIGVEGGQLAVVLLSWVGVFPFRGEKTYRRRIVIPLSLGIAGLGIFWTIERILG